MQQPLFCVIGSASAAPAPAAALSLAARMGAAAAALLVVVVGAVDIGVEDQLPGQIVGCGSVGAAGKAAEELDAGLHQGHLCAGADAAAENDVRTLPDEEAHQCAVALPIGGDDLGADELAVFGLVKLELGRAAEVLEHLTVFERNCNFHEKSLLYIIARRLPGCSSPASARPEA